MLNPKVKAYLQTHREAHLSSLCEMLRFPSISNVSEPDGCGPCAEWIAETMRAIGLQADILPTGGQPCVLGQWRAPGDAPTLLIYCHYDVQPPDPLAEWVTGPFEPTVRDGRLYARGASDDKGQLMMHLMAIEAYQRAVAGLPVHLKLLVEGEEEIGSPNMEAFLLENKERLSADAAIISDLGFFAEGRPAIIYALRGMCALELTFTGPNRDVHSGIEGGVIVNPLHALSSLVAACHDDRGRVTIPGFYDNVAAVSDEERAAWAKLPFDEAARAKDLGVDVLAGGEKGYSVLERNWARPTLECNGLSGGYSGPGAKTVIPSRTTAKFSLRLVAEQDPKRILASVERFVREHTPPGIRSEITIHATNAPVRVATDSPAMRAGRAAVLEAFGTEPVMIGCGASVPVTEQFQRILGLDAVMLGISLPDDNLHAPNECLRLEQLWNGAVMAAALYQNLARNDGG